MGRKVPEPVEHMVSAIMREKGISREKAYAIAVARLQQLGYLKKGTLNLTKKGKSKLSEHYKEPKKVRCKKVNMARVHKKSCSTMFGKTKKKKRRS